MALPRSVTALAQGKGEQTLRLIVLRVPVHETLERLELPVAPVRRTQPPGGKYREPARFGVAGIGFERRVRRPRLSTGRSAS